jgi:hypothetical protein
MNKPKWFCLKLLFVLCLGVISGCYKPLIIPENREMVVSAENILQFHCQLFEEHKKPYFEAYYNSFYKIVVIRCANETQFVGCSRHTRFEIFRSRYIAPTSGKKIYLTSRGVGASVWVRAYCTPRNYFAP